MTGGTLSGFRDEREFAKEEEGGTFEVVSVCVRT